VDDANLATPTQKEAQHSRIRCTPNATPMHPQCAPGVGQRHGRLEDALAPAQAVLKGGEVAVHHAGGGRAHVGRLDDLG